MLRLPATVIPLTRGEIAQYETRNERRRGAQLGKTLQETKPPLQHGRVPHTDFLHLRKGPQRSVSYGRSPSPTSMSSTDDDFATQRSSSFESNVEDTYPSLRGGDPRAVSSELRVNSPRLRRDSTLSYEETTNLGAYDGHCSDDGQRKSDSPPYGQEYDPFQGLLGLTLADEIQTGRTLRSSSQPYRHISHTRSRSDPSETSVAKHVVKRERRSLTTSSASGSSRSQLDNIDEHDGAGNFHQKRSYDTTHDRHHSSPEAPFVAQSDLASEGHITIQEAASQPINDTSSAMARCIRNTRSPLDEIIERASRSTARAPKMPVRADTTNVTRHRFPTFLDDAEVSNRGLSSVRRRDIDGAVPELEEDELSASYATDPPELSTRSSIATPRGTDSVVVNGAESSRAHGREWHAEFNLPEVRSNLLPYRSNPRQAIRRRPLPDAEQENESQEAPLYAQRRAWLARQMAPPQGRLEATPSPDASERRTR